MRKRKGSLEDVAGCVPWKVNRGETRKHVWERVQGEPGHSSYAKNVAVSRQTLWYVSRRPTRVCLCVCVCDKEAQYNVFCLKNTRTIDIVLLLST